MKKFCSFFLAVVMLVQVGSIGAFAASNQGFLVEVSYTKVGEEVHETAVFREAGDKTVVDRSITPDGVMTVFADGEYVSTMVADYEFYAGLVGTKEAFTENSLDAGISPMYETYGCGREYMIHKFITSETRTYYAAEIAGFATATGIAADLLKYFSAPVAVVMKFASAILAVWSASKPYKSVATIWYYSLYEAGTQLYQYDCIHALIANYTETGGLIDSHMEYYIR